jgi:hypothetical protein
VENRKIARQTRFMNFERNCLQLAIAQQERQQSVQSLQTVKRTLGVNFLKNPPTLVVLESQFQRTRWSRTVGLKLKLRCG